MSHTPRLTRRILNAGAGPAIAAAGLLIGRGLSQALAELNRVQWLPPAELDDRLNARVAGLLQYAARRVPFYREHLRRLGAGPAELRGVASLRLFPVMTKFAFRDGPLAPFLAEEVPEHRRLARRTSGSTGEPFPYYLDREALPFIYASHLYFDSWYGLQPFDRYLRISPPHHQDPVAPEAPAAVRLKQALTASLKHAYEKLTQEFVSVWEVDRERLELVYRRVAAFRPDFLLGYTSTLALFAEYLAERRLELPRCLRGVITIGETVTPLRRQLIANGFGAPIIDRYGLREFGAWSGQNCLESPDTFHVITELVALEILREDGRPAAPGEAGRVVITDLLNRVMPFIRYDTGDLAVQVDGSACPCGRGFPRMGAVEGRSVESVVTPSGRTVSAIVLGRYFREGGPLFQHKDHIRFMRHYQAVQQGPRRLRFLVVPETGFDAARQELLRQDLVRLTGDEMEVLVETVAQIPLERSGKRPLIKCLAGRGGSPLPHGRGSVTGCCF